MYRLKISGNFFLILNDSDLTEHSRHPAKDTKFQTYKELTINPIFNFLGINSIFNDKNKEGVSFEFDTLKDSSGVDFVSINALKTFLDNELGKSSGGAPSLPTQDIFSGGFVDYNDLATTTTPIPFTSSGYVVLSNDKQGAFTNENYLPTGVTSIYDANQFDFSELKLGDMIDIRLDLSVNTTSPNQEIKVDLVLGIGAGEYIIPFEDIFEKTTGLHLINRFNGIYMGDEVTLNNPAEFRLSSDGNGTVVVNGWYCKIIRKG